MKWDADVFLGSDSGRQTITVSSSTPFGAKRQIKQIYDVSDSDIWNLRRSSESSDSSSESSVGLILILGSFLAFMLWTPWILSLAGGALGSYFSSRFQLKVAFSLALVLSLGGLGFYSGQQIQSHYSDVQHTKSY